MTFLWGLRMVKGAHDLTRKTSWFALASPMLVDDHIQPLPPGFEGG